MRQEDRNYASTRNILSWKWTPCRVGSQKMAHVPIPATKVPRLIYKQRSGNDVPDRDRWRHGHIFYEACARQLQNLSFCSCQTYRDSLCQPSGQQWDHMDFCLTLLLLGRGVVVFFGGVVCLRVFCSVLVFLEQVFFHTWKLGLSLELCSFIMWIFSFILPFVLLNDKLSKYVQGLNSSVWILERCLLQMLLIK